MSRIQAHKESTGSSVIIGLFVALAVFICFCTPSAFAVDAPNIALNKNAYSLTVGGAFTLTSAATDSAGSSITGATVTWTTSSSKVSIIASGTSCKVTGIAAGTATVTATYYVSGTSIGSDSCLVTVAGLPVGKSATAGSGSSSGTYKVASSSGVTYVNPASKSIKTIVVPTTIKISGKTYKVTSVAAKAFYKYTKLTKVTIGSDVTVLGTSSFAGCSGLKTLSIGSSVLKTIGAKAFSGCKKLTAISITKTTGLTKSGVKNSMKGSSIKTVHVKSSKITAYKKIFTKANCGKSVTVKK